MPPMEEKPTNTTNLALIQQTLAYMSKDITEMRGDIKDIKNLYVTREKLDDELTTLRNDIEPLKKLVYGVLALVLTALVGSAMTFLLVRPHA